jgi:hypothetical protein
VAPTFGFVVEWSPSQRAFHVQSLAELVTGNLVRLAETIRQPGAYWPDFVPVAVFPTRDEASAAATRLVRMRDDPPTRPGPEMWPE